MKILDRRCFDKKGLLHSNILIETRISTSITEYIENTLSKKYFIFQRLKQIRYIRYA